MSAKHPESLDEAMDNVTVRVPNPPAPPAVRRAESPFRGLRLAAFAFSSEAHRMDADKAELQRLLDALNAEAHKFGLNVQIMVHD